ncbi:unnamed protein product [Lota lota]
MSSNLLKLNSNKAEIVVVAPKSLFQKTLWQTLIHAFITSRLDYYDGVLSGVPSKALDRLQQHQLHHLTISTTTTIIITSIITIPFISIPMTLSQDDRLESPSRSQMAPLLLCGWSCLGNAEVKSQAVLAVTEAPAVANTSSLTWAYTLGGQRPPPPSRWLCQLELGGSSEHQTPPLHKGYVPKLDPNARAEA